MAHFTRLAADSPVPLIVYNIPYRTGRVLSAQTLLDLASVPGIAGIKHAVGAIDQDTILLMAGRPDDFAVLAGDDVFASPLLALGAEGGILASAQLCTGEFADLIAAWRSGPAEQARELGHRLAPLATALFAEPNPAVIKGVLHAQGKIPSPGVRLPLLPARPDTVAAAVALLSQVHRTAGEAVGLASQFRHSDSVRPAASPDPAGWSLPQSGDHPQPVSCT